MRGNGTLHIELISREVRYPEIPAVSRTQIIAGFHVDVCQGDSRRADATGTLGIDMEPIDWQEFGRRKAA